MKTRSRKSLLDETINVHVKKEIILKAFKDGNKDAAKIVYRWREIIDQHGELCALYNQREISKGFYDTERKLLCDESTKMFLRFDVSKINAINFLKQKKGFKTSSSDEKDEVLEYLLKQRSLI